MTRVSNETRPRASSPIRVLRAIREIRADWITNGGISTARQRCGKSAINAFRVAQSTVWVQGDAMWILLAGNPPFKTTIPWPLRLWRDCVGLLRSLAFFFGVTTLHIVHSALCKLRGRALCRVRSALCTVHAALCKPHVCTALSTHCKDNQNTAFRIAMTVAIARAIVGASVRPGRQQWSQPAGSTSARVVLRTSVPCVHCPIKIRLDLHNHMQHTPMQIPPNDHAPSLSQMAVT